MKKILLMTIVAAFMLSSCTEDSAGVSKITTYAKMTLNGSDVLFWPLNTAFVDPGCVALEGATDISSKITSTASKVDVAKGGKYSVEYKVLNADGFAATSSRIVYVYDPASPLNGFYKSTISRTNTNTGAVASRGPYTILVFGIGGSNFWVEDLMGGWYYYGSGYGIGYAGTAQVKLNADNTLSVVKSDPTGFGSASACVFNATSTYNPATKTLMFHANMGDTPNLVFNVTMNTPAPLN
jgi:hypothetical protein